MKIMYIVSICICIICLYIKCELIAICFETIYTFIGKLKLNNNMMQIKMDINISYAVIA